MSKIIIKKDNTSKVSKRIFILSSLFVTTLFFNINNAMAQSSGTMSQNGLGKQLMNMGQEASSTAGLLFTFGCYITALIFFIVGVWAFYKNHKEPGRHTGLITLGLASFILTGVSVGAPKWINYAANSATHADAQYNNDKTNIIDIK